MERFCQEYIKSLDNQTDAAISAGYASGRACKRASQLMADSRIQERIAQLMQQRNKRTKMSADNVLKRLVDMLDADIADILNEKGDIKPISEWSPIWRKSVAAFDIIDIDGDTRIKKVKLLDKIKVLELIGKHVDINAFRDRVQVDVNVSLADKLASARKRAQQGSIE
ncbi:terminase small subunit [Proteus columbae]|uniref:terminase small subunit n=1 Tax=Proteus columbae TaxID=1987580 RepID=UPI00288C4310|nr:terminase small subunit [Proteus columbae]